MSKKICGIYKITNPFGKIYIGQSVDINRRHTDYYYCNCKSQRLIYNSISKYGWNKHKFEIIEECPINELNEKERYWQDYYNVLDRDIGLNLCLTNTHDKSGHISLETKRMISLKSKLWYKENKHPLQGKMVSAETKMKQSRSRKGLLSGVKNPNYGKIGALNHNFGKKRPKSFIEKVSGSNNKRSVMVINLINGIYYDSISDAAVSIGWKRERLKGHLYGRTKKNKTPFIIC